MESEGLKMQRNPKDIAALVALRGRATARDIADDLRLYTTRDIARVDRLLYLAEQLGLVELCDGGEYEYTATAVQGTARTPQNH